MTYVLRRGRKLKKSTVEFLLITFQLRSQTGISSLSFKLSTIHVSSSLQGNSTEARRPVLSDEPNQEVRSKGLLTRTSPCPMLPEAENQPDPTTWEAATSRLETLSLREVGESRYFPECLRDGQRCA